MKALFTLLMCTAIGTAGIDHWTQIPAPPAGSGIISYPFSVDTLVSSEYYTFDHGENWIQYSQPGWNALIPWNFSCGTVPRIEYWTGTSDFRSTADFGASWVDSEPGWVSSIFPDVVDSAKVWITTDQPNGVQVSFDFGATWNPRSGELPSEITCFAQSKLNPAMLFCGGFNLSLNRYFLARSTNEGLNWEIVVPSFPNDVPSDRFYQKPVNMSVSPYDSSLVLLSTRDMNEGADNRLYRSTDAGLSWTQVDLSDVPCGDPSDFSRLFFHPSVPGIVYWLRSRATEFGVMKSYDDGMSWVRLGELQNANPSLLIGWVNQVTPPTVFVSNASGFCEYTDYGEVAVTPTESKPNAFELFEAFPNPFNPNTTVQFTLSQPGFAELSVFSLYGELIEVLLASYQDAGLHTLQFDGSELASGVYFIQLKAGGEVQTRKVMLLK
jgi:hypothetical protein